MNTQPHLHVTLMMHLDSQMNQLFSVSTLNANIFAYRYNECESVHTILSHFQEK